MSQIYLSLGTNLGDRRQNLQEAVRRLGAEMKVTAVSPVYETEPWGETDQPQFLNICLAATTTQEPRQLLTSLKQIEQDLGREESYRWGPRLIDIDIIFYDDVVVAEEGLNIPHARMAERVFVLAPLADIAPDRMDPTTGKTVVEMLNAIYRTDVYRQPDSLFTDREDWETNH
jgi:2-amino-4-hydroxy-6-hydroxymethyldihydropteridine diphosphokinase